METLKKWGKYFLAGLALFVGLFFATRTSRSPVPQTEVKLPTDYKEKHDEIVALQEKAEQAVKPVPKTEASNMASAIDEFRKV